MAAAPTCLMALKPKRMAKPSSDSLSFSIVKSLSERLISGPKILMPICRQLSIVIAIFSSLFIECEFDSMLITAVMYSTG